MSATMRVYVRPAHLPREEWPKADKGKPFELDGLTFERDEKGLHYSWKPFLPVRRTPFINPDEALWYATVHDRWTPLVHRATGLYGSLEQGAEAVLDQEGPEGSSMYVLEVWGRNPDRVVDLWQDIRTGKAVPRVPFGGPADISTIEQLITEGLQTDGGHHKQWYLEQIAVALGINLDGIQREPGIPA